MDRKSLRPSMMRNAGLDFVRALAVLLVIGRHLPLTPDSSLVQRIWHGIGWIGVDLFFVLSGFLISNLIFEEIERKGVFDVRRFLVRRAFKIYPPFYFLIFATLLVGGGDFRTRTVLGEMLFLQNYLGSIWNHTWSLAVEEHFYLFWAAIVTFLLRKSQRIEFGQVLIVYVAVAILCLGARFSGLYLHPDFSYRLHVFGTHIRIDSLLLGALLASAYRSSLYLRTLSGIVKYLALGIGMAIIVLIAFADLEKSKMLQSVGFTIISFGCALVVLVFVQIEITSNVVTRTLVNVGKASYVTYLVHMPVIKVLGFAELKTQYQMPETISVVVTVATCLMLGALLHTFIEKPVLLLRDRLAP